MDVVVAGGHGQILRPRHLTDAPGRVALTPDLDRPGEVARDDVASVLVAVAEP